MMTKEDELKNQIESALGFRLALEKLVEYNLEPVGIDVILSELELMKLKVFGFKMAKMYDLEEMVNAHKANSGK